MSRGSTGRSRPHDPSGQLPRPARPTAVAAPVSPKIRAERVAVIAAAALALGKLGVGLATNSIGLLSAAADSLFDVAISSFNLLSIRIADSPADEGHPFGHGKAENLAGLLQTAVIALVGGWLLVEAVRRLLRGDQPEHAEWGIAVMLVATVASWLIARHLRRVGRDTDSVVLMADALHYQTDVWTNAGVLVGLALLWATGSGVFDALIGIGVACVILGSAYRLLVRSINDLMDAALPEVEQRAIEEVIHRHRFVVDHQISERGAPAPSATSTSRSWPAGTCRSARRTTSWITWRRRSRRRSRGRTVVVHAEPALDCTDPAAAPARRGRTSSPTSLRGSRMLKNAEAIGRACHSQEQPGGAHARRRSASGHDVQLRGPRAAGPGGPPPAGDPHDGRHGPPGALARVRAAVPEDGAPVDPARAAAARPAGADAVLGPERAPAHGAAGLQPALPLVRGPQHG